MALDGRQFGRELANSKVFTLEKRWPDAPWFYQILRYVNALWPRGLAFLPLFDRCIWFYHPNAVFTERIVENPLFLKRALSYDTGARILDVGCNGSLMVPYLLATGYAVDGIDLRPPGYSHPHFRYFQGDVCKLGESWDIEERYEFIYSISVLEHIGLQTEYGVETATGNDALAVRNLRRLLKPAGTFMLSVPFGPARVCPGFRVYDFPDLQRLCGDINSAHYYVRDGAWWREASREEAEARETKAIPGSGLAVVELGP